MELSLIGATGLTLVGAIGLTLVGASTLSLVGATELSWGERVLTAGGVQSRGMGPMVTELRVLASLVLALIASSAEAQVSNLDGTYDIELDFLPDPGLLGLRIPNATALQQSDIPPLTTAIQDQLGLKLESERSPVEVILIERVQLPTAN